MNKVNWLVFVVFGLLVDAKNTCYHVYNFGGHSKFGECTQNIHLLTKSYICLIPQW